MIVVMKLFGKFLDFSDNTESDPVALSSLSERRNVEAVQLGASSRRDDGHRQFVDIDTHAGCKL